MLETLRRRQPRQSSQPLAEEITQLSQSIETLCPGRPVPLRVRLGLRINDRTARTTSMVSFFGGMVIGLWWPMPIVFALDDRPGSLSNMTTRLYSAAEVTVSHADTPGKMISDLTHTAIAFICVVAYYTIAALGPLVLAYRISRGHAGFKFPGRKSVILNRQTSTVRACTSTVAALAGALGKTGERRVSQLHIAIEELAKLRKLLRYLPRLEAGPRGGRRRRRRLVRHHVRMVDAFLEDLQDRAGNADDQEVRKIGEITLNLSIRLADRRYRALLETNQLREEDAPKSEPYRLLIGALLTLLLSGSSVALLGLLGLSEGLEPVAIAVSVIVSAVIVFRGRALEKLESIGIFGRSGGGNQP